MHPGESALPRQQRGRLAAADGFRALAALAIVTGHLVMFSALSMNGRAIVVALLTSFGICGVDCFFVLSGFLLAQPYIEALIEPGRPLPSARDFAARRFLRIYPLYALAVVCSAIGPMLHRHQGLPLGYLVTHLTFLHGFSVHYINAIQDGPLWTMAVDVQFYLALPLIAAALAHGLRDRDRTTRIRALVVTLAAVTIASLGLRWFAYTHIPLTMHSFAAAAVYARNVLGMGSAFAFGAVIALLRATTPAPSRAVGFASIAIGVLIGLALAPTGLDTSPYVAVQVTYDFFAAAAVAFALYGTSAAQRFLPRAASAQPAKVRRRVAGGSLVAFVAVISYPFYLFHWPVLMVAVDLVGSRFAAHSGSPEYAIAIAGLTLAATIAVAVIAHVVVERVIGSLRQRYAGGRGLASAPRAIEVVAGELRTSELASPEMAAEGA